MLQDAGIKHNSTVSLIALTPFELYIQDMHGKQHVVVVPFSEPEVSTMNVAQPINYTYVLNKYGIRVHPQSLSSCTRLVSIAIHVFQV